MLAVILVVLLFFLAAGPLERALGPTGINVATRLLGMLLAALSVQFVHRRDARFQVICRLSRRLQARRGILSDPHGQLRYRRLIYLVLLGSVIAAYFFVANRHRTWARSRATPCSGG
jgi:hypothetical protein